MSARASILLFLGLLLGGCGVIRQDLGSTILPADGGADGSLDATPDGDVTTPPPASVVVSLGARHGCLIRQGLFYCWGRQLQGQLGQLDESAVYVARGENCVRSPEPSPGLDGIGAFAAGADFTCGLRNGEAWCWGRNAFGELGRGGLPDRDRHPMATPVRTNLRFTTIALGRGHACAIRQGGQVLCWGLNHRRQLGIATDAVERCPVDATDATELGITGADVPCSTVPVEVPGVADATELYATEDQTCARRASGSMVCWGANEWAQLGLGTDDPADAPPTPMVMNSIRVLAMGARHGCALDTASEIRCWGAEDRGQTGLGQVTPSQCGTRAACRPMPTLVTSLRDGRLLAAGGDRTCAVLADGHAWCWGSDLFHGLGMHDPTGSCSGEPCSTLPMRQRDEITVTGIAMGRGHGCIVNIEGLVLCWGQNDFYQAGGNDGSLADGVEFPQRIYF